MLERLTKWQNGIQEITGKISSLLTEKAKLEKSIDDMLTTDPMKTISLQTRLQQIPGEIKAAEEIKAAFITKKPITFDEWLAGYRADLAELEPARDLPISDIMAARHNLALALKAYDESYGEYSSAFYRVRSKWESIWREINPDMTPGQYQSMNSRLGNLPPNRPELYAPIGPDDLLE